MNQRAALIRWSMKTPRAAAIAGIIFSVLLISSQLLISVSVSADAIGSAREIIDHSKTISFALNLLPFAGIAFLWFIGVVRDRLGEEEDRFFSTVFLGSGLLYIAMMFVSAALAGALIRLLSGGAPGLIQSGTYALDRAEIYQFNRVFWSKDGWSVYDLNLYNLATNRDRPRLDRGRRLCAVSVPLAGSRNVDPSSFPGLDISHQRIHPD